jgi:hypothetical protein
MTIDVVMPEERERDMFFFRQSAAPPMSIQPAPMHPAMPVPPTLPEEPISLPAPPPETT